MDKYYITARITAKQGCEEKLLRAIRTNIPNVLAEDGCERYELLRHRDDPCVFFFQETWRDRAAFEAHRVAPHMLRYRETNGHLLDKPTEVNIWRAAAE